MNVRTNSKKAPASRGTTAPESNPNSSRRGFRRGFRRGPVGKRVRQGAPEAARRAGEAPAVGGAHGSEGLHRLRGPRRRRQGRHDQGDHRARQSARLSRHRPSRPDRAREVADVHAALPAALARRRRSRHLRPELVQPRRGRARHGLLHPGADRAFPEGRSAGREVDHRVGNHPAQVLAGGQPRGADATAESRASRTGARSGSSRRWT